MRQVLGDWLAVSSSHTGSSYPSFCLQTMQKYFLGFSGCWLFIIRLLILKFVWAGKEFLLRFKPACLFLKTLCRFQQKVLFCPVKEALEVDWSGEKAKAALKRTAPDYFLLQGKAWSWSHPRQTPALTTALWPGVDAVWVSLSPSQHRVVRCSLTEVWFLITFLNLSKWLVHC